MRVTLLEIAAASNIPHSTLCKYIKQLTVDKKFEKKTPGKLYNRNEVSQLEKIFDFQFKPAL